MFHATGSTEGITFSRGSSLLRSSRIIHCCRLAKASRSSCRWVFRHSSGQTEYYTILYYTILFYSILFYSILYYTILYYTILYYYRFKLRRQAPSAMQQGSSCHQLAPTASGHLRLHEHAPRVRQQLAQACATELCCSSKACWSQPLQGRSLA